MAVMGTLQVSRLLFTIVILQCDKGRNHKIAKTLQTNGSNHGRGLLIESKMGRRLGDPIKQPNSCVTSNIFIICCNRKEMSIQNGLKCILGGPKTESIDNFFAEFPTEGHLLQFVAPPVTEEPIDEVGCRNAVYMICYELNLQHVLAQIKRAVLDLLDTWDWSSDQRCGKQQGIPELLSQKEQWATPSSEQRSSKCMKTKTKLIGLSLKEMNNLS